MSYFYIMPCCLINEYVSYPAKLEGTLHNVPLLCTFPTTEGPNILQSSTRRDRYKLGVTAFLTMPAHHGFQEFGGNLFLLGRRFHGIRQSTARGGWSSNRVQRFLLGGIGPHSTLGTYRQPQLVVRCFLFSISCLLDDVTIE